MSQEVLNRDLSQFKLVSFDIFDTAVIRSTAEPRDVFLFMEQKINDSHGYSLADGFAEKREATEIELVERVWAEDRSNEVTLSQIYRALTHNHPEYTGLEEIIASIELLAERELTMRNPLVFSVYKKALELNKKIIFASDIYLPRVHLENILKDARYDVYEKLYISNEIGCNKASGSMFTHILKDTGLHPSEIIHFGDNIYSDVESAANKGFSVQQVPYSADLLRRNRYYPERYPRELKGSFFRGIQKNYLLNDYSNSSSDIGYEVLGPLVYGFLNWIIAHAEKKGITDLYFIAREGWFLKKAFDKIAEHRDLGLGGHYLLASRRSLLFPFIQDDVANNVLSFALSTKPVRLSKYLNSIEVDATQEQLNSVGFDSLEQVIDPYRNPLEHEQLVKLLELISPQILQRAAEEKGLYRDYLKSLGMLSSDHVGVVDSGWFGSGQSRLHRFLSEDNEASKLSGFYFALHKDGEKNFSETSQGYGYLYQFDTFNGNIENFLEIARIIEVLLSAPAESFKRFRMVGEKLTPVYVKENTNPQLDPILEGIQRGALQYIDEHLALDPARKHTPPREIMRHLLTDFIDNPSAREAEQLGSLPYEANMLQDGPAVMFARADKGVIDVLARPLKTLNEFNSCNWRMGYFRNIKSPIVRFFLTSTSRYFLKEKHAYKILKRVKNKFIPNRSS